MTTAVIADVAAAAVVVTVTATAAAFSSLHRSGGASAGAVGRVTPLFDLKVAGGGRSDFAYYSITILASAFKRFNGPLRYGNTVIVDFRGGGYSPV